MFRIAGCSPILEQECHVADAVVESRLGKGDVGWGAHIKLNPIERHQFEPSAAAVIGIREANQFAHGVHLKSA